MRRGKGSALTPRPGAKVRDGDFPSEYLPRGLLPEVKIGSYVAGNADTRAALVHQGDFSLLNPAALPEAHYANKQVAVNLDELRHSRPRKGFPKCEKNRSREWSRHLRGRAIYERNQIAEGKVWQGKLKGLR